MCLDIPYDAIVSCKTEWRPQIMETHHSLQVRTKLPTSECVKQPLVKDPKDVSTEGE